MTQCLLGLGNLRQVGYIETAAAKVGTKLKSGWTVLEVWGTCPAHRLAHVDKAGRDTRRSIK